jgi:hypothetical protein
MTAPPRACLGKTGDSLNVTANMIKKEEIAAEVDQTLRNIYRILEKSTRYVNDNCPEAEAQTYRHAIGKIFYTLIFDLWEPLYQEHPGLKPADWDDEKSRN